MKKKIIKMINITLKLFGIEIRQVKLTGDFTMEDALKRLQKRGLNLNTIIDIGASDGKWSLRAMKYFPNSYFLALEPLYERKKALANLANEYEKFSYEIIAIGSEKDRNIKLNVAIDLDGSTIGGVGGIEREIQTGTLNEVVKKNNLKPPYLLKFDTHGFETRILEGGKEILNDVEIIIMEVYNFHITKYAKLFYEMCMLLENLGFRPLDLVDPMLRKKDKFLWQFDLFFIKKSNNAFNYNLYE